MDRDLEHLARAVVTAAERHHCDRVSAEFRCAVDDLRSHLIARQEPARGAPELMERALHPWAYPGLKPVGGTRMGAERGPGFVIGMDVVPVAFDPADQETLP